MKSVARAARRVVVIIGATLASVGGALLLAPGAAYAAPQVMLSVNGGPFTNAPATPLIDFVDVMPGQSKVGTLGIRNPFGEDGTVTLQAINVINLENGCLGAEVAAGDTTCGGGDDQGELGAAMTYRVETATTLAGLWTLTWTGGTAALQAVADVHLTVPSTADRYLRVTATLSAATGNIVQTDGLDFDVRVTLTSNAGNGGGVIPGGPAGPAPSTSPTTPPTSTAPTSPSAGIGGVSAGPSGATGGSSSGGSGGHSNSGRGIAGLSVTGAPVFFVGGAGLLLLSLGALIVSFTRDRRRRTL